MKIRSSHCIAAAVALTGLAAPYSPGGASGSVTFGTLTLGAPHRYGYVEPAIAAHPATANVLYVMSAVDATPTDQNKVWRLTVTSWSPLTVSVSDVVVLDTEGVDVDLAVSDDTDADPATATLFAATLFDRKVRAYPVDGTGALSGPATTTNLVTPTPQLLLDRQWVTAAPGGKAYASWFSFPNLREFYAPIPSAGGTATGEPVSNIQRSNAGPIAVSSTHAFIAYPGPGTINVARRELAAQAGVWTNATAGVATTNEFFPVVGVAGSKVYVTWSDGLDVYFAASSDNGLTFGTPQRVAEGTVERTSTLPTLVVAPSGAVAVAYYEGDGNPTVAARNSPAGTSWYVKVAINTDPLGGGTWDVSTANPNPVHRGSISAQGNTSCTSDTQRDSSQLADDFEITRTADGHLALAYPTDAPGDPQCDVIPTVSVQTGGPLLT